MPNFKCTACSSVFDDDINGIICCPECGKVQPIPPDLSEEQLEKIYNEAILASNRVKNASNIEELVFVFEQLGTYQDAYYQAQRCRQKLSDAKKDEKYTVALQKLENETVRSCRDAIAIFEELGDWRSSSFKLEEAKVKLQELLKKREKKRELLAKITMIACAVILVLGLATWLVIEYAVPAIRYSSALRKIEKGEYDEGYAILIELGDYKDAPLEILKSKYNRAVQYEASGDILTACDFYGQAIGYADASDRLYNHCKNLTIEQQLSVLDIGNTVLFGRYDQSLETDGKELIEWIIVDRVDGKALLVSKYALEGTYYSLGAKPWSQTELCAWLNNAEEGFIKNSFSLSARAKLVEQNISTIYTDETGAQQVDLAEKSKVFILSKSESERYFPTNDERVAYAPQRFIAMGSACPVPVNPGNNCAHYWLRDAIMSSGNAMYVNGSGGVNETGKVCDEYTILGVRPAIWVYE